MDAPATEISGLISKLATCVTTDYSVTDLVNLALEFQKTGLKIYSAVTSSYTLTVGGISYVGTRYEEWADLMKHVDAGLDPNDTSVAIPEPQASSTTLGSATNGASPQDYAGLANNGLVT